MFGALLAGFIAGRLLDSGDPLSPETRKKINSLTKKQKQELYRMIKVQSKLSASTTTSTSITPST